MRCGSVEGVVAMGLGSKRIQAVVSGRTLEALININHIQQIGVVLGTGGPMSERECAGPHFRWRIVSARPSRTTSFSRR